MTKSRLVTYLCCCLVLCGILAGGATAAAAGYLGPAELIAAKDGSALFVLCADARQVAVVTLADGKVARSIAVPAEPTGLALSPDGGTLYVTCAGPTGTVCVIEAASGKLLATIPVGHTAVAPVVSPDGKRLYACNRFNNSVSVIDLAARKETARVATVREPFASAITPDGKLLLVANLLPNDRADGSDVAAVVTLIDTATQQASSLRLPNGSGSLRGICVSPDGKYAFIAHILSRYQMPATQLERGWMNTNALSILDTATRKLVNTVLLDEIDLGAANPWGVACTADGKTVCVAHAGTNELSVIDMPAVLAKLARLPAEAKPGKPAAGYENASSLVASDVPNDLAFLVGLRRRVPLAGIGPRGVAIVGTKAYAALYYSDALAVVQLDAKPEAIKPLGTIPLGPAPHLSVQRRGEMLFNNATICFQHWQSCGSCHPDARMDGFNWDLTNDGIGNTKNNKSMLLAHKTPPSMWEGVRPNGESAVRSGITHILFAVRPQEEAAAIDEYLKAIEPLPSPHLVRGQLSEAANRGKALFFSERIGCAACHPAPHYTDLLMHDVESKGPYDRHSEFDTPSLIETWRTAPYLHDGRYVTLKQLIQEGKHGKKHGAVEKLTEQEINDLVEFVLSL